MDKIVVFEYTPAGKYTAQGGSPSGREGYNIWIQYPDDDMLVFLGFSDMLDFEQNVAYYQSIGDRVFTTRRNDA